MKTNLFVKLLSLHNSTVPLKDFTTEVLGGILSSNQSLLDTFVNRVLKISGSNFRVKTRNYYKMTNRQELVCRVDLVFDNQDSLCFLESSLGVNQASNLPRYAQILHSYSGHYQNVFLRYCTKYEHLRIPEEYRPLNTDQFYQFRWKDIYVFLMTSVRLDDLLPQQSLIYEFLDFLERCHLHTIPDFNYDNLKAMRLFRSTLTKMEDCLTSIKPHFTNAFGSPSSVDQVNSFYRYALWKHSHPRGKNYIEILVGFNFEKEPEIIAQCFSDKKNSTYEKFLDLIHSHSLKFTKSREYHTFHLTSGAGFLLKRDLYEFVSESENWHKIYHCLLGYIQIIRKFIAEHPELDWGEIKRPS